MAVDMEIHPSVFNSAPGSDEAVAAQARKDRAERIKGYREAPDPAPRAEELKRFSPPGTKITIASLDNKKLTVTAQYNPKELQVDRSVPWQHRISPEVDRLVLEYSGEEGRSLNIDLLFDGYEENLSVQDEIDKLEIMTRANVPADSRPHMVSSYDEDKQTVVTRDTRTEDQKEQEEAQSKEGTTMRPHWCVVSWGELWPDPFRCVIESIRTRYTMISETGVPLRANVSLALREANEVAVSSLEDRRTLAESERKYRAEYFGRWQQTLSQNVRMGMHNEHNKPGGNRMPQ